MWGEGEHRVQLIDVDDWVKLAVEQGLGEAGAFSVLALTANL